MVYYSIGHMANSKFRCWPILVQKGVKVMKVFELIVKFLDKVILYVFAYVKFSK